MAVVLVAIVGVIFTLHKGVYPEVFSHPFHTTDGHVTSPATIALAMYGVLWSYDGWYVCKAYFEEKTSLVANFPYQKNNQNIMSGTFQYSISNIPFHCGTVIMAHFAECFPESSDSLTESISLIIFCRNAMNYALEETKDVKRYCDSLAATQYSE